MITQNSTQSNIIYLSGADPAFLIGKGGERDGGRRTTSDIFLWDQMLGNYSKSLGFFYSIKNFLNFRGSTFYHSIVIANLSFCFKIYFKFNLVLPLGFKVVNRKNLHSKNLNRKFNIFQLINFCNCRIPTSNFIFVISYLCKKRLNHMQKF